MNKTTACALAFLLLFQLSANEPVKGIQINGAINLNRTKITDPLQVAEKLLNNPCFTCNYTKGCTSQHETKVFLEEM